LDNEAVVGTDGNDGCGLIAKMGANGNGAVVRELVVVGERENNGLKRTVGAKEDGNVEVLGVGTNVGEEVVWNVGAGNG
jgi:hypothetical protein